MAAGPLNTVAAASSSSWKLVPEHARKTQGLVVSPFGHLHATEALFLKLEQGAGGSWLQSLLDALKISDATGSREDTEGAAIAFTWTGLRAMNLPQSALESFSTPFCEGMHQPDRQRRLGDVDDPERGTVIAGGARWSGNTPDPALASGPDTRPGGEPQAQPTPITVHCALLIYAAEDAALAARLTPIEALLSTQHVEISHRCRLSLRQDQDGVGHEHFGFADGMSQPVPIGDGIIPATGPGAAEEQRWHGVKAGEILFGHANAHGEAAPGPVVPIASEASLANAALTSDGAPQGFLNLGLDGSYLVIRELRQDVASFWNSMDQAAQAMGQPQVDATWLAERVIGRTLGGDPLKPGGVIAPQNGEPANDFGYAETDLNGFGCPLGAHVRRANPRDSLPSRDGATPRLGDAETLLSAANAHRILRRGRKYGPDLADTRQDDGADRGLMFMCLNSDLVRQFEFVQQSWLLNPSFATLFDETDPLLGPPGAFTIPACPLRLRPEVKTYVQMAGGEYFFLPSLPALRYLAGLKPGAPEAQQP